MDYCFIIYFDIYPFVLVTNFFYSEEDIEIICITVTKYARAYIEDFKDGNQKEYLNAVMEYLKVMSRNLYTME